MLEARDGSFVCDCDRKSALLVSLGLSIRVAFSIRFRSLAKGFLNSSSWKPTGSLPHPLGLLGFDVNFQFLNLP